MKYILEFGLIVGIDINFFQGCKAVFNSFLFKVIETAFAG